MNHEPGRGKEVNRLERDQVLAAASQAAAVMAAAVVSESMHQAHRMLVPEATGTARLSAEDKDDLKRIVMDLQEGYELRVLVCFDRLLPQVLASVERAAESR